MLIKQTGKRGGVGPSFKGQFYSYEQNGHLRLNAWPPARGKARTVDQQIAQDLFKEACEACKRMDAQFINYARLNCKGTPMLPRDALFAALYGRMPTIILPNGEKRYALATRVDMSALMDNLGDQPGMLLFRDTDELWKGLPIGSVSQILAVDEDGAPAWIDQPAGGGGGGGWWYKPNENSQVSDDIASVGPYMQAVVPMNVSALFFKHNFPAGSTYKAGVYLLDSAGTIVQILAQTIFTPSAFGSAAYTGVGFPTPAKIDVGQEFCIFITRTDGTGSSNCAIWGGSTRTSDAPSPTNWGYCQLRSTDPQVGDVVSHGTAYPYAVWFQA